MAKAKQSAFVCESCGYDTSRWLGRCPSCGEWNSLREVRIASGKTSAGRSSLLPGVLQEAPVPQLLSEVEACPPKRYPTGIGELDRVLGGGLVPGTTVLLGGEPGIGKSTLMLQVAAVLPGKGLYVSGEESPVQVKNRADRLSLAQDSLDILCETNLENLLAVLENTRPAYLVIDSIQTLLSMEAGAVPGTPNQLKTAGYRLTAWAKASHTPLFLIAHVTREGTIAGPKVIEHLVDTVLYFDHSSTDLRILRASKNRMGSVDEVGLFRMGPQGLLPIPDPAGLFLEHRRDNVPVGSAVTAVYEGSRILLVEIQALTVTAKGASGRVYADRMDSARVSRVAAVLERHAGLRLSDQDIYVNVAGGLRVTDTGSELALAMALFSARSEKPVPRELMSVGELSLAGEVRPVPHLRRRIKTAVDTGLSRWIAASAEDEAGTFPGQGTPCRSIKEAVAAAASA
ncbi:MAG: DNA repair protein RadA [Spirochaetales bacterium]|nr:MAG: DNA repair protein RadA [Spirochaetales bacterium]